MYLDPILCDHTIAFQGRTNNWNNKFPLKEVSLTTNMDKQEMEDRRLTWEYTPVYSNDKEEEEKKEKDVPAITLKKQEIRTFKFTP